MLKRNSYELAENIWLLETKQGSISETLFSVTLDGLVTFGKKKHNLQQSRKFDDSSWFK